MNKRKRLLLLGVTCGAALALSAHANAAAVSGQLIITSNFTITPTSLGFCPAPTDPCPTTGTGSFNIPSTGTGDFAGNGYSNDTNGFTVTNLNNTNAPPGTVLAGNGLLFLTFNPSAALPTPDIELFVKEIFAGVGGSADCTLAPAPGQTCTPTGSAVTFLNTAGGNSSATISGTGFADRISTSQLSALSLNFTSDFNVPFQTVLADFATTPSLSQSEAGTFTATPEPSTSMLMGSGFLALAFMLRRRRRS